MRSFRAPALLAVLVSGVLSGAPGAPVEARPAPNPLEPASGGGLAAVDRALARLSIHARLLVVGAHPDDEDNALLTWISRGMGGEAAYLSLSRGEGGQNLIGPELGEPLGVIRTGELMAAREIEGTRQFFARAFDFGYTRSLEETFGRWPRELLLEDAIRAARRFQPQVVVAIFPADERAGHGQHQASAVIARDIFERAGDESLLPELGLPAWAPSALYRRAWSRDDATLGFDLGRLDPIDGRSLGQIAAASRSRHRSQDMGIVQPLGSWPGGLVWLAGRGEGGEGPFAGIDTRLAAIASTLDPGEVKSGIEASLERVETLARDARRRLAPATLAEAVPTLVEILRELDEALTALGEGAAESSVRALIAEKRALAGAALNAAAGVVVDAIADAETAVQGSTLGVAASVWSTEPVEVEVTSIDLIGVGELEVRERTGPTQERGVDTWSFQVAVPPDARPSEPYYLQSARIGDLYDWGGVPEAARGTPWGVPVAVRFDLRVAGAETSLTREVVHRYADQAIGEVRRPLRIVPSIEVELAPASRIATPEAASELGGTLTLVSNADASVSGELEVSAPAGWRTASEESWTIGEPRGSATSAIEVSAPAEPGDFRYTVSARAGDSTFSAAYPTIEYPHVRPMPYRVDAETRVRVVELELPEVGTIGYVRGASDRVPEVLGEVGLEVELLDAVDLQTGDLSVYDVVVVGSRAYETDPALRRSNGRLLDFVRAGGLLIVQYQQYQFVRGDYAPLPLDIDRPHGRVTDESSPVTVLDPDHPVFRRPNPLGPEDWDGWVQERGLYFASSWDDAYTPLLELQDPGQPAQRGALLVAEVGRGTYVYTGLSFFRELPARVPGAIRLFANLLALGER